MDSNKIAIVIPYFGKWPKYFSIFLQSCKNNQNIIDFIFFTDIKRPNIYPENVSFQLFSLKDFNTLASQKIGLEVSVSKPYKLCDFKPCYGLIFEDYLRQYEFWGHGDEDLILGDLSQFLPALIEKYDFISVRKEWNSGAFSIFKNNERLKKLFLESEDFTQKVVTSSALLGFDEVFCENQMYRNEKLDLKTVEKQSMTYVIRTSGVNAYYHTIIKECIDDNDFVKYDHGKITQKNGKEFLLYHYIIEKKRFQFEFPDWSEVPEVFYIDNSGFYTEADFENNLEKIRAGRIRRGKVRMIKYYFKRLREKIVGKNV